jgi:hypothetical protein
MKYLRGLRLLPLILSANGTGILKWWVDAAFAAHPNIEDIVEEAYLWEGDFPSCVWPSRNSIPKALWNWKSWVLMTSCRQSGGLDTSQKSKDTKSGTMFCSRTTRAQFFWKRMERL